MSKLIALTVLAGLLAFGLSCPPNQDSNNTLVPRTWGQAYSDKENSGFNAVHTVQAYSATRKWTLPVGPLAFSAPALGPDGTIYIGNADGELVAINPNGTEKWRRKLAASILSTPAVNPATNEIFVLAQDAAPAGTISSKLYRLDSGAALHTISSLAMSTSAAPKLWGDFVFVSNGSGRLWVFDQPTLNELGHVDATSCFNLVCGGGVGWPQAVVDFLACVVDLTACPSPPLAPPPGPLIEPSVAIVDAATLVQDPAQPTVVVIGPQCASGFRFHPAGDAPQVSPPTDSHFELLWSHALVAVDCDVQADATRRSTTPAAIEGGLVVFNSTSQVTFPPLFALDVQTGQPVWTAFPNRIMQNPVASALRPIYAATETQFEIRDSNGSITNILPLQGKGYAVAVSLDWVYVTTDKGIHTFTLDGNLVTYFDSTLTTGVGNGMSFPVVGADGVVYVSTPDGYVRAYGSTEPQPLVIAANFPGAAWQTPTDGGTLPYAAGQSLVVNVTGANGAAFDGTVTFTSDVDGTLCEAVPAGPTATCVTTRPLTLGTHQLSAIATDTTGATFNATITVEVANTNTAPTVTIQQPLNDAILFSGTPITFSATVSDPEEPTFPEDHVTWQSSLDGDLGTGTTVMHALSNGSHVITVTATDAGGLTGQASVDVTVQPPVQ